MSEDTIGFILSKQAEMGCEGLSREELEAAVSSGWAIVDQFPEGFAVINPEKRAVHYSPCSHLWLLWLHPDHRGRGLGKIIVRRLIKEHAAVYYMTLVCDGGSRAKFFGRCGFKVVERSGERCSMQTWR